MNLPAGSRRDEKRVRPERTRVTAGDSERLVGWQPVCWRGPIVGGLALVVLLGASACSREEIVVDGSRPGATTQSVPSTPSTEDAGGTATNPGEAPTSAAARVAARLSAAPVGALAPAERRSLLAIGLRAAGLTAEEAGCITSDPRVGNDTSVASPVQGVPPDVLAKCVPGPRLAELATNPSLDLGAISAGDLAAVVTPAVTSALAAAGLQPAEADCVAKAATAAVDVSGLGAFLGGSATVPTIDAAMVTRCVGASRIAELAG